MSIVNRSHGFIFIHVPKAAGTSVTRVLSSFTQVGDAEVGGSEFGEAVAEPYRTRFGISKHSTAREIREIVGDVVWSTSFTFGFVRNPYERAFSTYRFLKDRFRAWKGSEVMDGFHSFETFVSSAFFYSEGPDRLLRPQVFWLRDSDVDAAPCVDFVGRVESINEDMGVVLERCVGRSQRPASPPQTIPRVNAAAPADSWRAAYREETTQRLVYERYAIDFHCFGYQTQVHTSESEQRVTR